MHAPNGGIKQPAPRRCGLPLAQDGKLRSLNPLASLCHPVEQDLLGGQLARAAASRRAVPSRIRGERDGVLGTLYAGRRAHRFERHRPEPRDHRGDAGSKPALAEPIDVRFCQRHIRIADRRLSAGLRHAGSPMSAKPVIRLCGRCSRSTAFACISEADGDTMGPNQSARGMPLRAMARCTVERAASLATVARPSLLASVGRPSAHPGSRAPRRTRRPGAGCRASSGRVRRRRAAAGPVRSRLSGRL